MSSPCAAIISAWRYSGRWWSNLETTTCASVAKVALPRAMALTGAGAWTIFSQDRQLYLGRTLRTTRQRTGTMSSISCASEPSGRNAPPQSEQVQAPDSGSWMTSSRGRCPGKLRTGTGRATTPLSVPSGTGASRSVSSSSSASSSCSISRPSFSDEAPNCMRRSRAICPRSVSMSRSRAASAALARASEASSAAIRAVASTGETGASDTLFP